VRAKSELLCFDLDGTLVDSAPDLNFVLGEALRCVGREAPTLAQTRSWIGDGIENLLRRALQHFGSSDAETFRSALAELHRVYPSNLFSRSRLYPNVGSVLASLRDAGSRLCCITNKRQDYAVALLEQAEISGFFEFTFGGDSFAEKKPHPMQLAEAAKRSAANPRRCVMIGDSDTDSIAAAAAEFQFVWAAFGYCPELKSRDVRTVPTASRFADIPDILETLVP
jgi:phosphoglycolate phosphatase